METWSSGPGQISMALPVKMASGLGVLEHVSFMIADCRLQIEVDAFLTGRF